MQLRTINLFDSSLQVLTVTNVSNQQEKHAIFERDSMCIALVSQDKIYLDLSCAYYERQDSDDDIAAIVSEIETELKMNNLRVIIINNDETLRVDYE